MAPTAPPGAVPTEAPPKPAIILVEPQLGENIGYAARAMLNFGLTDLRLVAPRDGWPHPAARPAPSRADACLALAHVFATPQEATPLPTPAARPNPDAGPHAAGADAVLGRAPVFETPEEALAHLNHVYASTVRNRDIYKPVLTVTEASEAMHASAARGERTGILFGRERSGLSNDDIALANAILTVPVNPGFGSLNLAQAVILVAFEWSRTGVDLPAASTLEDDPIATKADLVGLVEHLEGALAPRGYFRPPARQPALVQALRTPCAARGVPAPRARPQGRWPVLFRGRRSQLRGRGQRQRARRGPLLQ